MLQSRKNLHYGWTEADHTDKRFIQSHRDCKNRTDRFSFDPYSRNLVLLGDGPDFTQFFC